MTYILFESTGPFFSAYRDTAVSNLQALQPIPMSDVKGARSTSLGTGVTPDLSMNKGRAYVVAEARTSGGGSQYNLCDVEIAENTGETSQGYQVRNNPASATVLMDDACYGTVTRTPATYRVAQRQGSSDFDSNIEETRMMGVMTQ